MEPLTFGERLALMRRRRKLTQQELAEHIGCRQSDIHRLEVGLVRDPHLSRAVALAHALQVSLDWLAGLRDTTDEADTMPPAPPPTKRQRRRKPAVA